MVSKLCLFFPGYDSPEFVGFSRVRMRLIQKLQDYGIRVYSGGMVAPKNSIQISWGQPFDTKADREVWDRKENAVFSIGYTVFESDIMPNGWAESFEQHDVVWSASNFCCDIIRKELAEKNINKKVYNIQHGIDSSQFLPMRRDFYRGTNRSSDPFTFLWVGMNPNDRKRGADVARIFNQIKTKNMRLIIKYVPLHNPTGQFLEVDGVSYISKFYSHQELLATLYNSDAFIYPSRCEGFGLQPLEFGATGLPCAITAYSGMMDYLYDASSVWLSNYDYFKRLRSVDLNRFDNSEGLHSAMFYPLKEFNLNRSFYLEEEQRYSSLVNSCKEKNIPLPENHRDINYGEWDAKDAIVTDEEIAKSMQFMFENQYDLKLLTHEMARYIHREWTWDRAVTQILQCLNDNGLLQDLEWETPLIFNSNTQFLKIGHNSKSYPTMLKYTVQEEQNENSKILNPLEVMDEDINTGFTKREFEV